MYNYLYLVPTYFIGKRLDALRPELTRRKLVHSNRPLAIATHPRKMHKNNLCGCPPGGFGWRLTKILQLTIILIFVYTFSYHESQWPSRNGRLEWTSFLLVEPLRLNHIFKQIHLIKKMWLWFNIFDLFLNNHIEDETQELFMNFISYSILVQFSHCLVGPINKHMLN